MNQITEYFLEQNPSILTEAPTEQLLSGLVATWNWAFIEYLGTDPFSVRNHFSFLLARFETIDDELMPKFSTY